MVEVSRRMRGGDRQALRAELAKSQKAVATVDKQLGNWADAVARGGAGALGEALVARAAQLKTERQRLLLDEARFRPSLAAGAAMVLDERRITGNLDRLGALLPALAPDERKELMRLFVERVDVRRIPPRPRSKMVAGSDLGERLMEVRIKLHLGELVRGLEERAKVNRPAMSLRLRGLDLSAQVDFSNAQCGEVTIMTPFRQTLRLDARIRVVPPTAPTVEHPIVRARRWHQILETGRVPHRLALATLVGVDPAMVTRTLKLNQLAPEIQEYLVALKTPSGIWHFNLKTLCAMTDLSLGAPRAEFAKLLGRYNRQGLQQRARIKTVPIVPVAKPTLRTGPRLSAG